MRGNLPTLEVKANSIAITGLGRSRTGMPFVIDGNTNPHRIVNPDMTHEFAIAFLHPLSRGDALTPEFLALTPDPYFVKPPDRGGIPEIFGDGFVWTVKDSIKSIIEELEPGVHTFIPVNLRIRGSDKNHGQYYILYPEQVIDAVVIDETDFGEGKGRAGFGKEISPGIRSHTLSPFGRTVLDGRLIAGRHLWRGGRGKLGGGGDPFWAVLFCSDALADKIKAAGAEGWRFRKCELQAGT